VSGRFVLRFVIDEQVGFESPVHIERSDAHGGDRLRGANPGGWEPVEWDELLDGRLGPWAMAREGERVVSICHTPLAMTPSSAECGVWTDPAFRGRGYAAAVTAAWATLLRPTGRALFYSCDETNASSRRVAERLGLRSLGRVWRDDGDDDGGKLHPLCTLRRRA
jgi:RimJ/RimL family protein N-acetyltransferase